MLILYWTSYYRKWTARVGLWVVNDIVNSVCEENNSGSGNDRLKGVRVLLGKVVRMHLPWNTRGMRSQRGSRDANIYRAEGSQEQKKKIKQINPSSSHEISIRVPPTTMSLSFLNAKQWFHKWERSIKFIWIRDFHILTWGSHHDGCNINNSIHTLYIVLFSNNSNYIKHTH